MEGGVNISIERAGREKADDSLGFRRLQGGMPIIQDDSGPVVTDFAHQSGVSNAAGNPGSAGENAEQLHADGLATLFLRRPDVEVGRDPERPKAVGVHDPQS